MYNKVDYVNGQTVIEAENLNDMQAFDESLERDKADKANTYTKADVDEMIADATPADYETVKAQVETNKTDISSVKEEITEIFDELEFAQLYEYTINLGEYIPSATGIGYDLARSVSTGFIAKKTGKLRFVGNSSDKNGKKFSCRILEYADEKLSTYLNKATVIINGDLIELLPQCNFFRICFYYNAGESDTIDMDTVNENCKVACYFSVKNINENVSENTKHIAEIEYDTKDLIVNTTIEPQWELGHITDSNGNQSQSNNRIRVKNKIKLSDYTSVQCAIQSGYKYDLYFYNDAVYLGHVDWLKKDTLDIFNYYPNATDLIIVLADTSDRNITDIASYSTKITITGKRNKINFIDRNTERINEIEERTTKPNYKPKKMVTLVDDDGFSYFYKYLLPIIKELKVPITSPNVASHTFEDTHLQYGTMTWDKLDECVLNGAEVCSHSYSDIQRIIDNQGNRLMSDEEVLYDFIMSRNMMKMHGVNSDAIVYPNSSDEYERIGELAMLAGYKYGFTGGIQKIHKRGEFDRYMISRYDMDDKLMDLNAIKNTIDVAWDGKDTGWMVLKIHTSYDSWKDETKRNTMLANIRQMISYIRSKGITFVTMETAASEYIV